MKWPALTTLVAHLRLGHHLATVDYCDLEDLVVAQILSHLDDSVDIHCSRPLAPYTTRVCGMEWILAIIDEMNKVIQRLGLRGGNRKNETRAPRRLFCAKRVKKDSKKSDESEEEST